MRILSGHRGPVRCVAYSPDGRYLASGAEDNTVRVWQLETGCQVQCLDNSGGYASSVAIAASGVAVVAGGSVQGLLRGWNLDNGFRNETGCEATTILNLVVSGNGRLLAAAGQSNIHRTLVSWVLDDSLSVPKAQIASIPDFGYGIALSPDNTLLASGGWSDEGGYQIGLWTLTSHFTGRLSWRRHHGLLGESLRRVAILAFQPNGRNLVSVTRPLRANRQGDCRLWDIHTGEQLHSFSMPPDSGEPLAFSADARILAVTGPPSTVRVIDTASGRELAAYDWDIGPIYAAAFAPDGMTAAAGGRDFRIVVWDLEL